MQNQIFGKMRRADREIDESECIDIVSRNSVGVLSFNNAKVYPYGVPLNYFYDNNALYFNCANEGKKLNLISVNNKVCFTITDKNEVLTNEFSNNYRSIIILGDIKIINGKTLKHDILLKFAGSLGCKDTEKIKRYIESKSSDCGVFKLKIVHMSGKARK